MFKIKVIETLNHFLQLELHWKSLFLTLLNRPLRRSPKTVKNLRYWPLLAWWMWLLESLFLKTLHFQCEKVCWKSITLLSQSDRNVKFFITRPMTMRIHFYYGRWPENLFWWRELAPCWNMRSLAEDLKCSSTLDGLYYPGLLNYGFENFRATCSLILRDHLRRPSKN